MKNFAAYGKIVSKFLFEKGNFAVLGTFLTKSEKLSFFKDAGVFPFLLGGGLLLLAVAAVILVVCMKNRKTDIVVEETLEPKENMPAVKIGSVSRIGARDNQQDSFAITPVELFTERGLLAVVADGMGGLSDGEKVSQLVVSTMMEGFMAVDRISENVLMALVGEANQQVNSFLGEDRIGKCGSTVVAGLICDGKFHYISVGDSRIALYRDGQLLQLNREHIFLHDLRLFVLNGVYDMQDDEINSRADNLTSFIGMGHLKYVDIPAEPVKIVPGDKFILMSDGVFNALDEDELLQALKHEPQTAADQIEKLIEAKAFRNQDNYTALILEV